MNRIFRGKLKTGLLGDQRGTTLVEMITVVVMLGALLAVAAPNYSRWLEKRVINAESQKLYLDLLLARSSAIKNNNDVVVTFIPGTNSYRIHSDTNGDRVEDTGEAVKSVGLDSRVQYGFFGSSVLDVDGNTDNTTVALVGGGNSLFFDASGQASTSGQVYLIHGRDASVSNFRLKSISIIEVTGGVDLWRYDSGLTPPWK